MHSTPPALSLILRLLWIFVNPVQVTWSMCKSGFMQLDNRVKGSKRSPQHWLGTSHQCLASFTPHVDWCWIYYLAVYLLIINRCVGLSSQRLNGCGLLHGPSRLAVWITRPWHHLYMSYAWCYLLSIPMGQESFNFLFTWSLSGHCLIKKHECSDTPIWNL